MDGMMEFLSSGPGMAVAGVVAALVGWVAFSLDTNKEERRRRALAISQKLAGLGFKRLPVVFNDYAVGDYSGMFRELHELHEILSDPAQRQAEFQKVVQLLIEEKLKDPEKLAELRKLVDKAQAALNSSNPLAAAADLAASAMDVARTGTIGNHLLTVEDSPLIPKLDRLETLLKSFVDKTATDKPAA